MGHFTEEAVDAELIAETEPKTEPIVTGKL